MAVRPLVLLMMLLLFEGSTAEVQGCGYISGQALELSPNATVAKAGQFPWHAVVYKLNQKGEYSQYCGGVIVSSRFVISAAHCFYDDARKEKREPGQYLVEFGKLLKKQGAEKDNPHVVSKEVEDIFLLDQFKGTALYLQSDIAVLKLKNEIEFNQFVHQICLTDKGINADEVYFNGKSNMAIVPGMGVDVNGKPVDELTYIYAPGKAKEDCYQHVPRNFREYLTHDKLCAGNMNGTTPCLGFGGSGLVFESDVHNEKRWFLLGITSVGLTGDSPTACVPNQYVAFTNIRYHMDWIRGIIKA